LTESAKIAKMRRNNELERGSVYTQTRFALVIEIFPGIGAIKVPDLGACQNFGIHETNIHAHAISGFVGGSPVGHASAIWASMKFQPLVVTHIDIRRSFRPGKVDMAGGIICPQNAIAPTYGAVAIRDTAWAGIDTKADSAAMT
jgi:hypothetical protein